MYQMFHRVEKATIHSTKIIGITNGVTSPTNPFLSMQKCGPFLFLSYIFVPKIFFFMFSFESASESLKVLKNIELDEKRSNFYFNHLKIIMLYDQTGRWNLA